MKYFKYTSITLAAISIVACSKTEFDDFEELTPGTANFSNYISVGNSLTQGFQDNGLHNEYAQQSNSYPAIIAKQMGTNFVQPLVTGDGSGHMKLIYENGEITPANSGDPGGAVEDPSWSTWGDQTKKYNNLGISGIRLADCFPDPNTSFSSTINQFILSNNAMGRFLDFGAPFTNEISYLDYIAASNATFFTCWLGNNDVLGWATSGGDDGTVSVPVFGTLNISELTPPSKFEPIYDTILGTFQKMGAKGVCATIPDVTSIPFFNTVTLEAVGKEVWITEGPYASNPGNVRKAVAGDLMTLNASADLGDGIGFTQANPLPHTSVLDKDEVAMAQSHTVLLNNIIKNMAAKRGYAVADMHSYMYELKAGMTFDGVNYTASYIEGGGFSLDGVHPNTRGYAIIANKFMEVINNSYGSNLRPVPVQDYRGIIFP